MSFNIGLLLVSSNIPFKYTHLLKTNLTDCKINLNLVMRTPMMSHCYLKSTKIKL